MLPVHLTHPTSRGHNAPFCACPPGAVLDFGAFTVYAALLHSALHITRYILENSSDLIYHHVVNRSGIVALFFLLPTVLPMMYRRFKLLVSRGMEGPLLVLLGCTRRHSPLLAEALAPCSCRWGLVRYSRRRPLS